MTEQVIHDRDGRPIKAGDILQGPYWPEPVRVKMVKIHEQFSSSVSITCVGWASNTDFTKLVKREFFEQYVTILDESTLKLQRQSTTAGSSSAQVRYPVYSWVGIGPPAIYSLPDPDCRDAFNAWENSLHSTTVATEINPEVGFIKMPGMNPVERVLDQAPYLKLLIKPDKKQDAYRSHDFRYFVRKSEYGGTPSLKLFQLVYVNTITHTWSTTSTYGDTEERTSHYQYYPPSPITNFVVCPIPGRAYGEFALTLRFGEFLFNQSKPFGQSLLQELNSYDFAPAGQSEIHTIPQAVRLLFYQEKDLFQGGKLHGWKQRTRGPRFGVDTFVESRFDVHFLPTLLDTDLFNVERWPNYPSSKTYTVIKGLTPDPLRRHFGMQSATEEEKHFFLMITPHRNWTLVMLNYPVSTCFGPKGEVLSTEMSMEWVLWLVRGIAYLLSRKGNLVEPNQEQLKERHRYWEIVGKKDPNRREYDERRKGAVNLPVVPLESALIHVEGDRPKPVWEAPSLKPKQICYRCGEWVDSGSAKCQKCGASVL